MSRIRVVSKSSYLGGKPGREYDVTEREYRQHGPRGSGTLLRKAPEGASISDEAITLADKHRLDLGSIEGTGADGNVLVSDVKSAVSERQQAVADAAGRTPDADVVARMGAEEAEAMPIEGTAEAAEATKTKKRSSKT
jgi:hypothetical protein